MRERKEHFTKHRCALIVYHIIKDSRQFFSESLMPRDFASQIVGQPKARNEIMWPETHLYDLAKHIFKLQLSALEVADLPEKWKPKEATSTDDKDSKDGKRQPKNQGAEHRVDQARGVINLTGSATKGVNQEDTGLAVVEHSTDATQGALDTIPCHHRFVSIWARQWRNVFGCAQRLDPMNCVSLEKWKCGTSQCSKSTLLIRAAIMRATKVYSDYAVSRMALANSRG